jgi:hypothetical protein
LVSTAAGKAGVCCVLLFVFLNATLPLMTASAFWYDLSTIDVNAPQLL